MLMLLAAALLPVRVAHAATITVNTTADEFGTGASCALREAIQAANTDAAFGGCAAGSGADEIVLPAGTYTLALIGQNDDTNATGDLDVTASVTINGADRTTTIIDANNIDAIFDTFAAPSTMSLVLNDLTLRNGNPTGASFDGGGAIYVHNVVTLKLTRVNVLNNTAATSGGAIFNNGAVTAVSSLFSNNIANDFGGAIYNQTGAPAGTVVISNTTLSGNRAEIGGAIFTSTDVGINLTVENSTLSGNKAEDRPGVSIGDFGFGGAIYAASDGGVVLQTSTVSGNTGAKEGGGIYFQDLTNPGITGTLSIVNSTVADNAGADGGGVYVNTGAATVRNTIIADNTDTGGANNYPDVAGTFIDGGNNLIGKNDGSNFASGTLIGTTVAPVNPELSALDDNGGSTFTHALAGTSPAVNAIATGTRSALDQPATCTAGVSTDQRGTARANGTTTGSACDIGSFEYASSPTSVTIADFSSQPSAGSGPQLAWATADESTLAGFHVWRGTVSAAETRLTARLIPAAGGMEGHTYTWQDPAALNPGEQTYYWLEVVNSDGASSFVGPVAAQGSGQLYLPMIGR